jgi:hypothetical protein
MNPINDFNLLVSRDYGYGLGNRLVNANKFCACLKPLLSVWEICGSCRDAMDAMANNGLNCFPAGETKLDLSKFAIDTAPYELIPDVERNVSKKDAPPRPREIVSYLRERPPNFASHISKTSSGIYGKNSRGVMPGSYHGWGKGARSILSWSYGLILARLRGQVGTEFERIG